MIVALQTQLAEGAKSLLGDASTASSLSLQWSLTDVALQTEERLLYDMTSLWVVRESVMCVVQAAEDVRAYLARSKDDWAQLHTLDLTSEHLSIFPDLELNDNFIQHLQDVLDLPLTAGGMAAGEPLHAVAIEEENVKVFRLLYQNAQRLPGLARLSWL
jgi:hypothetical protein